MVVGIIISAIVVMIIFGVLVSKRKKKDRQVLLDAVKKKDKETVQQLILKGVKVDGYYYGDENPLSIAVESNDIEMVSILLEKVYNINYSSKNPLFIAIQNDNKDIVSLLIEKGANVNYEKAICLVSAIKNKNKEIVELLIENDAEIDIDYGDETPLILAIKNNDIEIVSFLLEKGADPNFNVDEMPLDFAKNQQIYALLKNKGAKTSAELEEEKRAEEERKRLEAEESRKKYELQRMLNEDLCTAAQKLDMAKAQYCILHGADVNYGTWSPTSFSPLMYAVSNGMRGIEMVKFLLQNGADPYKKYHQLGGGEINAIGIAKYVVKDESLVYFLEHYC